jgi:outer membrane receptor for ferrienterochelin and colicins
MMKYLFIIILCILPITNFAQNNHDHHFLRGKIFQKDSLGEAIPVPYANVFWLETNHGVITDSLGVFRLHKPVQDKDLNLVVSFIGYSPDTVLIETGKRYIEIGLDQSRMLEEVVISKNKASSVNSRLSMMPTQIITDVGLQKLACCNIGESFESNATIDVGFTDAVSGAKKIRMLGLDGKYSQFLFENVPFMRGPEAGYGLSHIPGPFMESIQVSKGTSSVLNGYESTTGQINVEYKKPADTDLLFVNLFANTEGRYESNITSGLRLNNNWAGMILFHGSTQNAELDHNSDGFYDKPLQKQFNFLNRWEYNPDGLLHLQFGVEVLKEGRIGGQLSYKGRNENPGSLYGIDIDINKLRLFGKLGFAFPENPNQSIGWINSFTYFDQNSLFGLREYNGKTKSYYSNLIWQTQVNNPGNKLSSGISFQYDNYDEFFIDEDYLRREYIPGIFSQYTYSVPEKLVFMTGARLDYNSEFGLLFTPRIHFKYSLNEHLILRSTLGVSHRSPSIFAENMSYLASSRAFIIDPDIRMENALNTGASLTRHFHLPDQREASLSVDFYHTRFSSQMIVDIDHSVSELNIYNLDGKSYSNAFQADFTGEIFKGFDMTLAYRYNNVMVDYIDGLREMPFINKHKYLFTTTYSTRFDKWKFDLTVQRNGKSRIPDTDENPEAFRFERESPSYYMIHAQITRRFKHFELYTGVENLGSYRQERAILDPENPFGDYFDATMVWGPLTNRMFYGGLRFTIK